MLLVRRRAPYLLVTRATAPTTVRDLTVVVGAALVACATSAALGTFGVRLIGEVGDLTTFLVWWGRSTAGMLAVGLVGMLVLAAVATWRENRAAGVASHTPSRRKLVEGASLVLASGLVLGLVFGAAEALPVGFLLLVTTVVVAIRLGQLSSALHSLAVGTGAVALTLAGRGPFAQIADIAECALVAQAFVALTVVTGLVLALNRAERDQALARLSVLQQETEARAAMLAAVLEHMQEGLAVVDANGSFLVRNTAGHELMGQRRDPYLDFSLLGSHMGLRHVE